MLPRLPRVALVFGLALPVSAGGSTTGLVPLTDLGDGDYQGYPGGLYPNGLNHRPADHHFAGLAQAAQVVPRAADGTPDPVAGSIGLISFGYSNVKQAFDGFLAVTSGSPELAPELVFVNAAKKGMTATEVVDPLHPDWGHVDQAVADAGLSPLQVQALWFVQDAFTAEPFPGKPTNLAAAFEIIMGHLRDRFPNLRVAYCSSRLYGGYTSGVFATEPHAFESGFAVRWLIEAQVAGDPDLNYDPARGPVEAPWIAWGPYNWADGLSPASNGLSWDVSDFEPDGVHPSAAGELKVGERLHQFLRTDATSRSWYLAAPPPNCGVQALAEPYGTGHGGANGVVRCVISEVPTLPSSTPVNLHAWGGSPGQWGVFLLGATPLSDGLVPWLGGSLLVLPVFGELRLLDPDGRATWSLGPLPEDGTLCGGELYFQVVAGDPDSAQGYDLSRGLRVRFGD